MQDAFEKIICDSDTALFRAAKFIQEDYVIVTHKASGKTMEFQNQTAFWGHWAKKAGGWLAEKNEERVEKGLNPFTPEDFEIEECARLSPEITNHLAEAEKTFDFYVGHIKKIANCKDYELVIGGKDNFRYDAAHILPYKGERKDKPILFEEVRDLILTKYKNKVTVTEGIEADDYLGIKGFENYQHYLKTKEWKYLLCYIDKDLDMIISPSVNPDKVEDGIKYTTPEMAAECFCLQLLSGDKSTDNIQGLPNFTEEIQTKYKLGKTRGVGKATAEKYLDGCTSIKEMFGRVVEAYRSYYGDDVQILKSHRGDELEYTWLEYLQENAILLWMMRTPDEKYDITSTLDKLGIDYADSQTN